MSQPEKHYYATVETSSHSFELPVYAANLEEALEFAEAEYQELGEVTRVREARVE